MLTLVQNIINIGTSGVENPEEIKRIRLSNLITLTVFTTGTPFAFIFYFFGSHLSGLVLIGYILSFLFIFRLNKIRRYKLARLIMIVIMIGAVIHYSIWYGEGSGIHHMLLPFGCVPFLIFDKDNNAVMWSTVFVSMTSFILIDFISFEPVLELDDQSLSVIYHGIIFLAVVWIVLEMLYMFNQNNMAITNLSQQRKNQTGAIVNAQEEERKRIARDLHDGLGQVLSAAKVNLLKTPEKDAAIFNSLGLIDQAVTEIKNTAFNLMPLTLEQLGLIAALEELIDKTTELSTFDIHLHVAGFDGLKIGQQQQYNIYRIIQEAVNNAMKHANATEITIQLVRLGSELTIMIEDDGKGFDSSKKDNRGNGLHNMAARVEWLDGIFAIDSQAGRGTTVIIAVEANSLY